MNGATYTGGAVKFDTNNPIDCGVGYTGDEIENGISVTKKVQYLQDLVAPSYYYTDTFWLSNMGFENYLNCILGNGTDTSRLTMPVLVSVPSNYVLFDEETSLGFVRDLYLLAYYNGLSSADKNNADFNDIIFKKISGKALPFLPSQVACLKFYDGDNNFVPFTTAGILDTNIVKSCSYKSPTTGNEYPVKFYAKSDGVICDLYIGGYHMQLLTYDNSNRNNDFTDTNVVYVSACNDTDFCNKFWFSVARATIGSRSNVSSTENQYGYAFGKDKSGGTIAWVDSRIAGEPPQKNLIRYYKAVTDNTGLPIGNGLALDFDPDIYNAIGLNYSSKFSTVGILTRLANLDEIGTDEFDRGLDTPLYQADKFHDAPLPLGLYFLDPTYQYYHAPTYLSSLRVYSPDGNIIVQEATPSSRTDDCTLFRTNKLVNNTDSQNYANGWSSWSNYAWH